MDQLIEHLETLKITTTAAHSSMNNEDQEQQAKNEEMIQRYAKMVLDETFAHESKLSETDFGGNEAEHDVDIIINLLEAIGELCTTASHIPDEDSAVISVIGVDFAECLHWRIGALIYAFCSCKLAERDKIGDIDGDGRWLDDGDNQESLIRYLCDGVSHLRTMLGIRKAISGGRDSSGSGNSDDSGDTLLLLGRGIFSDTHLLAMMYAGEMCSWYHQYSHQWQMHVHTGEFDMQEFGLNMLTTYIYAVEKVLPPSAGWNCDRAKQLVEALQLQ